MPVPMLKSLANKSGKSLADAEKYWDEAKKSASEKFSKKDERYWAYVAGIVKRRLGLSESVSFKQYLTESTPDVDAMYEKGVQDLLIVDKNIIKNIKSNCNEYLVEAGDNPLFRGMSPKSSFSVKTHNDSSPRDSSDRLTSMISLYIEEKFRIKNIRRANRVYAMGDFLDTQIYTDNIDGIHFFFPVDGYRYIWSPKIIDATQDVDGTEYELRDILSGMNIEKGQSDKMLNDFIKLIRISGPIELKDVKNQKVYKDVRKAFIRWFDELKFTDTNLREGIKSGHEIVFQVKQYYAFPITLFTGGDYDYDSPTNVYKDLKKMYSRFYNEQLK